MTAAAVVPTAAAVPTASATAAATMTPESLHAHDGTPLYSTVNFSEPPAGVEPAEHRVQTGAPPRR